MTGRETGRLVYDVTYVLGSKTHTITIRGLDADDAYDEARWYLASKFPGASIQGKARLSSATTPQEAR